MEIVLYDGDCGLCEAAVRLVLRRDAQGRFRFASQRSETGRRLLAAHGASQAAGRTLVLLDEGRAYVRSEAVLRILSRLRGLSPLASLLRAVPRPVRDAGYDLVAAARRLLLGRQRRCLVLPAEQRARFLDVEGFRLGPSPAQES